VTPDWRVGVTHYFAKRLFLEARSVAECEVVIARLPISSSGSYVIGDAERAIVVEWLPSAAAIFDHGSRAAAHTNHILDPALAHYERYLDALPDSPDRYGRLCRLLAEGKATLPDVQRMLADHDGYPSSICRHGGHGDLYTQASVIFEPARRLMHLAYGNPCETPFATYAVDGSAAAA
jgi:isopenicillin-N N-acyltransferase-like protein